MRTFEYQDQSGICRMSEKEIIDTYFEDWKTKSNGSMTECECIADWIALNWAYEVKYGS